MLCGLKIAGLTRANLEAQLADATARRCWWVEDAIRADLRELARFAGKNAKNCVQCGEPFVEGPTSLDRERFERGECGGCQ